MRSLGRCADGRSFDNLFDVLRLAGATLVFLAHSWALTGRVSPSVAGDTLGGLGLCVFFSISGFLVLRSWDADPRLRAFAVKRFLRLLPALVATVLITAAVVGPIATSRDIGHYFSSHETHTYVTYNAVLQTRYSLPGVFAHNPGGDAVNGSLWTLPLEVKAYLLIPLIGLVLMVVRRRWAVVLAVAAGVAAVLTTGFADSWFYDSAGTRPMLAFVVGALLYLMRRRVPLNWTIGALVLAAWLVFGPSNSVAVRQAAWALCVPYLVLLVAYRGPLALRALVRPGDASYGMYLWAYVVQQSAVAVLGATSPWAIVGLGLPVAYACGLVSWRLVERPALQLRRRLDVRSAAPAKVAPA